MQIIPVINHSLRIKTTVFLLVAVLNLLSNIHLVLWPRSTALYNIFKNLTRNLGQSPTWVCPAP